MNTQTAKELEHHLHELFKKRTGQKHFKVTLHLSGAGAEWRDWNVSGDDFTEKSIFLRWEEIFPS